MSDWSDDDTPAGVGACGDTSGSKNDGANRKQGNDSGCRKCGQDGHFARDCPDAEKSSGCRKCGEDGHFARDCPEADKEQDKGCRKCGEEGHFARDCSLPDKCRRCGEEGHKVAECTAEETTRSYTVKGDDGEEVTREIYVPKHLEDDNLFGNEITTGINFEKYSDIPIDVQGVNAPKPVKSFEDAGLRPLILNNIKSSKYKIPTPIQKHSLPFIMAKRDLMACAQTGSGKTAAFLLPIIHNLLQDQCDPNSGCSTQTPNAVIMTPTRELAIQIWEQARKFAYGSNLKCVIAYGGTSVGAQLRTLERGCNILVATPGRLLDFVEKGRVSYSNLEYFVLDEADRMLDMGFGPEIAKCMEHTTMPDKKTRTTLMFSATFPKDVQLRAKDYLKDDKLFLTVGMVGAACSDVSQKFFETEKRKKKSKLLDILNDSERDPTERVLIFVKTKKNADFLATHLSSEGKPATSIHGDRLQREREEVLHDFKSGKFPILVATDVAARGLDIANVQKVVNYEMPDSVDEYVHRIGRTGRVGNVGCAISLFDPENDTGIVGPLSEMLSKCGVDVPEFLGGGGDGGAAAGGGAAADDEDGW